jgi:hypothetical protein
MAEAGTTYGAGLRHVVGVRGWPGHPGHHGLTSRQ